MSVLAVVDDLERVEPITRWAVRLALRLETDLVLAWPSEGEQPEDGVTIDPAATPDTEEALSRLTSLQRDVASDLLGQLAPSRTLHFVSYGDADQALAVSGEAEHHYVVAEVPRERRRDGPSLARRLFDSCPSNTVLLRLGADEGECSKLLVPLLKGFENVGALRLANALAGTEGQVTALAVEPPAFTEGEEVGKRWIARSMERAGVAEDERFSARVEFAARPEEVIARLSTEFDTVLFGASGLGTRAPNLRTPRSQLLGLIPDRLTKDGADQTIGVVREQWTLAARLQLRLGRWLEVSVPQLEREHRIALTERLQAGSEPNFDFFALMGLSTTIAAFGLVQNSAAVVIGAMLVAPLMMPILGAGLAIVQGNLPLLRSSATALFLGYSLALVISVLIGRMVSLELLTPQLLARGSPNMLDLGVAFFSGLAAAYCLARPDLSAALPGVAIAAALVPPIATTGIALAGAELETAVGALVLFCTNVAAIIVGAFISLYAGGLRPQPGSGGVRPWMRTAAIGAFVAVALLTWPLARSSVQRGAAELTQSAAAELSARSVIEQWLADGDELLRLEVLTQELAAATTKSADASAKDPSSAPRREETLTVIAVIAATDPPPQGAVDRLANRLSSTLERPIHLRLDTQLIARSTADTPLAN